MKTEYDAVVIGAGPAGSIAARTIAQAGLSTLLLEKRQEIGSPVRCAEAVGRETLEQFFQFEPHWIAAEIDAFSVSNPRGDCFVVPPEEPTLVLERKIFDRELARLAAEAGAQVMVKARAVGLIRGQNGIAGVKLVVQGKPIEVSAQIVIGADGTESQSPRWAGLKSIPQLKDYYSAAQYLLTNTSIDPRICQYHVGWSLAPGGYAWVFPKGSGQANVGLVIAVDPKETRTALDYLNEFVAARFPRSSILAQVVGGIPITGVISPMVTDGYMAVGDAAHQSDPLTAGGIGPGIVGGSYAGQVAIDAIRAGDVSAKFLNRYEKMWEDRWGKPYRALYRFRHALLKTPEEKISKMIAEASKLDVQHMSLKDILLIVMKTHPQMMLDIMPYFLGR